MSDLPDLVARIAPLRERTAELKDAPRSALDGVDMSLPALIVAQRQGEDAAAVGFDWADRSGAMAKIHEELAELDQALAASGGVADAAVVHEVGDLLLSVAQYARHLAVAPEQALRAANARFARRFREMERCAHAAGISLEDLDDAGLDALWNQAKAALAAPSPPANG